MVSSIIAKTVFQLTILNRKLAILDSGATIHVFNDLSRFRDLRKAPHGDFLQAGMTQAPILGYGTVDLQITKPNGSRGVLTLRNVAFSTEFVTVPLCNLARDHACISWLPTCT